MALYDSFINDLMVSGSIELTSFRELRNLRNKVDDLSRLLRSQDVVNPGTDPLTLPEDVVGEVLKFLHHETVFAARSVCQRWNTDLLKYITALTPLFFRGRSSASFDGRETVHHIIEPLPNLRYLDLQMVRSIVDRSFMRLFCNLDLPLVHLSLKGCEMITDKDLRILSESPFASRLVYLNLRFCQRITASGLCALLLRTPDLRQLDFSSTDLRNFPRSHRSIPSVWECIAANCPVLEECVPPEPTEVFLNCEQKVELYTAFYLPISCSQVETLSMEYEIDHVVDYWYPAETESADHSDTSIQYVPPYIDKLTYLSGAVATSVFMKIPAYHEDNIVVIVELRTNRGQFLIEFDNTNTGYVQTADFVVSLASRLCQDPVAFCVDYIKSLHGCGDDSAHYFKIMIIGLDDQKSIDHMLRSTDEVSDIFHKVDRVTNSGRFVSIYFCFASVAATVACSGGLCDR
eukprot:216873_1